MTLVCLHVESLDEMTNYVCDLFGNIVNKKVKEPSWPEHPYGADQLRKRVYAVPIKDIRKLVEKYFRTHISHIDTKIKHIEEKKNAEKEICNHTYEEEEAEKMEQTVECFHQKSVGKHKPLFLTGLCYLQN